MISLTRLRLRSVFFFPQFLWFNERVVRQIVRTPGFLAGSLLVDSWLTFWTMTAWRDESAMRAFRDSAAHRQAMPKLVQWCDEASVAEWTDSVALPSWQDAHAHLVQHGRSSRVRYPSGAHAARQFPPVRGMFPERRLVPS